jgi:hypothetical protein
MILKYGLLRNLDHLDHRLGAWTDREQSEGK